MKTIISTEKAPAAIGPYSQATEVNGLIITSGQLPIDPATGAFPEGIQAQTRQSLTNVKAVLEKAGVTMDQVLKTTVFLSDMNNFGAMNEVYATFFGEGGEGFLRVNIGCPRRNITEGICRLKEALDEAVEEKAHGVD